MMANRSLLAALLALGLLPTKLMACSFMPFSSMLADHSILLLGTALPDTVHAGAGRVEYALQPGHSEPAGERSIYGQLLQVQRIGGPGSRRIAENTDRVILVPWDYDASCKPVPWTQSARWAPTEAVAFYNPTLRDSVHWVNGIPTFDVRAPELQGYPHRAPLPPFADRPAATDTMLTAAQLFELYEALPAHTDLRQRDYAALDELRAWVAAHPDLARFYPARRLLFSADVAAARSLRDRTDHPLLGTYRFTFTIDGGPVREFYGRTRSRLAGEWDPRHTSRERPLPTLQPKVPVGYSFTTSAAPTLAGLPQRTHGHDAEAHFYALSQPDVEAADSVVWRGDIDVWLVSRTFPDDPELDALQKQWFEDFRAQHDEGHPTRARFIRYADGRVRVAATIRLSTGQVIRIEGEQLSRETIPPPG